MSRVIARGPRSAFEMEQVVPGRDPDDPDADPITESNDLKDAMPLQIWSASPSSPSSICRFMSSRNGSTAS